MLEQIKRAADELKRRREQINNLLESFDNLDHVREIYHVRYPGCGDRFNGKGVVYSSITGGYDFLNEPEVITPGVDYVLLTDSNVEGYEGAWDIRLLENQQRYSPVRLARWAKMHPFELFPEYDWSIWVDGALRVKGNLRDFIDFYKRNSGMVCFPHHNATDITMEANAIVSIGKAKADEINRQIDDYEKAGYLGKGYIIETGVLLRDHHDKALKKVMDDWWEELCTYDHSRDQMSFDYACWKNSYEYDLTDLLIYGNPWFEAAVVH